MAEIYDPAQPMPGDMPYDQVEQAAEQWCICPDPLGGRHDLSCSIHGREAGLAE